MHGDYQFANVMFEDGAPAKLAALIDWEMGTVGDPKLDLGWVVQSWPADTMAVEAETAGYANMYGMPSRDEVVAHYAEVSGRQVDDIDYYIVLAKWKLAVVLEQGYQRRGDDAKLDAFGPIVLDLMQGAADLAESSRLRRHREPIARCAPLTCPSTAPPEVVVVQELPDLVPGPGEVLVDIAYAAVNFPDVLIVNNEYQVQVPAPFVPGSEFSGVIAAVGDGVAGGEGGVAVGDHVYGASFVGAYAEQIVVHAASVTVIPDSVDLRDAAAFSVAHTTAMHTLRTIADLQPGESVLVLGAAGGVGLASVELATLLGGRGDRSGVVAREARAVRAVRRGGGDRLHEGRPQDARQGAHRWRRGRGRRPRRRSVLRAGAAGHEVGEPVRRGRVRVG